MSDGIVFDNFLITDDKNVADNYAAATWYVKHSVEDREANVRNYFIYLFILQIFWNKIVFFVLEIKKSFFFVLEIKLFRRFDRSGARKTVVVGCVYVRYFDAVRFSRAILLLRLF